MKILVLNSGSSTQKSALYDLASASFTEPVAPLWEGKLEWDGNKEKLTIHNSDGKKSKNTRLFRPTTAKPHSRSCSQNFGSRQGKSSAARQKFRLWDTASFMAAQNSPSL